MQLIYLKHYLNKEQVEALKNLPLEKTKTGKCYRDMFIFSCFGGGLRFADVVELKWENYIEDEQRIVKVIRKSGRGHQFKLPPTAIEILNKYKTPDAKPTDFIFPVMPTDAAYMLDGEFHYRTKMTKLIYLTPP